MMTRKSQNHIYADSRVASMNQLGLYIAINRPEKFCWCVLKAWSGVLAKF